MQLTPLIAIHMTLSLAAVAIGPVALWARLGSIKRPRIHRAFGYAWVTCMLGAAFSGLFIRDFNLPNIAGYTPIHLLIPFTFWTLFRAFRYLMQGNIKGHQLSMQWLYLGACVIAGFFTLVPGRYLGDWLWR